MLVPALSSTLGSSKGLPVRVTSRTAGTAGYLLSWDSFGKKEGARRALLGSQGTFPLLQGSSGFIGQPPTETEGGKATGYLSPLFTKPE